MLATWYLIIFIIFLIAIIFVASFNLYENERIKKKCPTSCQENQDMLLILNAIVIFIAVVLLFGYYFSSESCDPKTMTSMQQMQSRPTVPLAAPSLVAPSLAAPSLVAPSLAAPSIPVLGPVAAPMVRPTMQMQPQMQMSSTNPFSCLDQIDIVSKI